MTLRGNFRVLGRILDFAARLDAADLQWLIRRLTEVELPKAERTWRR